MREGNEHFVANMRSLQSFASAARRSELAAAQRPFAIVDRIRSCIAGVFPGRPWDNEPQLVLHAVRPNIDASVP